MRKANKLLALALCAGLTVVAFTGCGAKEAEKKETKTEKEENKSDDPFIKEAASYIDLAEYKTISLKTSEIDEKLQAQSIFIMSGKWMGKPLKVGLVQRKACLLVTI